MVNRKPSTGCESCRKRHVRCDEEKPSCQKCTSRGVVCPGYRDIGGIIFVDSTRKITERHTRRVKSPEVVQVIETPVADTRLATGLAITTEARAIAFFFSEYVNPLDNSATFARGHLDHLIPLYLSSEERSPLVLATTTLAYQALGLHEGHNRYQDVQASLELKACAALKSAIIDPVESLKNETLMSVLCLDFAAHLAAHQNITIACRAHLDGALALIRHRSADSIKDDAVAKALYATTRSNVLLQGLWFGDEHSERSIAALPKINLADDDPIHNIQHILAKALTFEHEMIRYPDVSIEQQQSRFIDAQDMNEELNTWYATMPLAWQSIVVQPYRPELISSRLIRVGSIVGLWYCVKLIVLKLMLGYSTDPVYGQVIPVESEMVLKGLYSVCQYLDYTSSLNLNTKPVIERSTGNIVVLARGQAPLTTGNLPKGQYHLFNLLRWVNDIISETRAGSGAIFCYETETRTWFRKRLEEFTAIHQNLCP